MQMLPVEQCIEALIDYRGKTPKKTESGVRLVTAKVIKSGRITNKSFEYIAEEDYDSWMRRGLPIKGDVLVTTEAPLGEVAQIECNEKIALAQRVILLRANPEIMDQDYLLFAIQSDLVQGGLNARATGTTVAGIKQSELRKVLLPCPDLKKQKVIAGILKTYDNLIENNNRRISILEDIAESLYREWFVKFRFPGHEGCQFKDSALGRIPEGWVVKTLKDVLELAYGKALKKEVRKGGNVPVYGSGGLGGWHDELLVQGPSIIVGRKGNVGSIFWVEEDCWPIDTVFYVKSDLSKSYLYYNLLFQTFHNSDAAVPGLNRESAYSNKLIVPSGSVIDNFDELIAPVFGQLKLLRKKNTILKEQRDMLLPKLISGNIKV
ncbi:MAG: type I restriction enzyme S subunit [Candidatus Azotimanducaceae bacterium]|jgi:type I restriction enzyme S subunit